VAIFDYYFQELTAGAAEPVLLGSFLWIAICGMRESGINGEDAAVAKVAERRAARWVQAV
jgi:hypothetical protein